MKNLLTYLILFGLQLTSYAQYHTTLDVSGDLEGVCHTDKIYCFYASFIQQEEAKCPVDDDEITKRLNAEVTYIKDNPRHRDKGTVALIVNCEGKLVICDMDDATKDKELDKQILKVFNSLGTWKAGIFKKENVDSCLFYNFRVKKGKIVLID